MCLFKVYVYQILVGVWGRVSEASLAGWKRLCVAKELGRVLVFESQNFLIKRCWPNRPEICVEILGVFCFRFSGGGIFEQVIFL